MRRRDVLGTRWAPAPGPAAEVARLARHAGDGPPHLVSYHVRFGEGRQARLARSPHRYAWPAELDLMGQLTGLELEHRYADWTGAEFTTESTTHISVYRLARS